MVIVIIPLHVVRHRTECVRCRALARWIGLLRMGHESSSNVDSRREMQRVSALGVKADLTAYFVAFGPHGPRAPYNPPNNTMKVIIGTTLSMLAAYGIVQAVRASGKRFLHLDRFQSLTYSSSPTKDFNTRVPGAIHRVPQEPKRQPYRRSSFTGQCRISLTIQSGLSSDGYKGKGMVQL